MRATRDAVSGISLGTGSHWLRAPRSKAATPASQSIYSELYTGGRHVDASLISVSSYPHESGSFGSPGLPRSLAASKSPRLLTRWMMGRRR